ncbi:hypothetical protein D9M68_774580 [compost metagenome]
MIRRTARSGNTLMSWNQLLAIIACRFPIQHALAICGKGSPQRLPTGLHQFVGQWPLNGLCLCRGQNFEQQFLNDSVQCARTDQ